MRLSEQPSISTDFLFGFQKIWRSFANDLPVFGRDGLAGDIRLRCHSMLALKSLRGRFGDFFDQLGDVAFDFVRPFVQGLHVLFVVGPQFGQQGDLGFFDLCAWHIVECTRTDRVDASGLFPDTHRFVLWLFEQLGQALTFVCCLVASSSHYRTAQTGQLAEL